MIAVLTGDVVGSQELKPEKLAELGSFLDEAAQLTELSICFEVFGGDSWQTTCHPPHSAVSLAVAIRAYLLGNAEIDTRICIGIGSYESIVPEKISLSQGEAFVLSGRGLKEMPGDRRVTTHLSDELPKTSAHLLHAATTLLDGLAIDWTPKQAQAVALAQTSLAQNELAKRFDPPISPQAFGKRLASAQWSLVKDALNSIELALEPLLSAAKTDR